MTDDAAATQAVLPDAESESAPDTPEPETRAGAANSDKSLGSLLAPVRGRLILAGAFQALGALMSLVPYVAIYRIVEELLQPAAANGNVVWAWAVIAVIGVLVRTAATGAAYTITHGADGTVGQALRQRLTDRLWRVPLGWFGERSSGQVKRRLQDDVHDVHHLVAHAINDLVGAIVAPLAGFVLLFVVNWRLGLVCLVPVLLYFVGLSVMMRGNTENAARWDEALGRVNSRIVEFVQGIAVVKTFGRTRSTQERYHAVGDELAVFFERCMGPLLRVNALASAVLAPPTVIALVLTTGAWFVHSGWAAPAEVLLALMIGVGLGAPVLNMGIGAQAMRTATAAAARLGDLLRTPVLPQIAHPRTPEGVVVEYDGVRFSYDGQTDVLSDIDLVLRSGTVTALVGPSGSGKSTLARLLPRFWDVTDGAIRIGGVDLRHAAPEEIYRRVAFVFQDNVLLRMSVRDNLRLAAPDADDATVEAAARAAQIHDVIMSMPQGYDTIVHEQVTPSGGETQRLCIARAMLADAPIVVLDEATAFADPESEAAVQDALSTLIAGRAVLVIAHRLRTITNADQIVVLEGGRIVESGRHDELLEHGRLYAALWNAQEGATT